MSSGGPEQVTLNTVHEDLQTGFTHLEQEVRDGFAELKGEVRDGFTDLKGEVRGGFAEPKSVVRGGFAELESEVTDGKPKKVDIDKMHAYRTPSATQPMSARSSSPRSSIRELQRSALGWSRGDRRTARR